LLRRHHWQDLWLSLFTDEYMSGKNNVNPGQYKVAGREKPGKPLGTERAQKDAFTRSRKQARGPGKTKARKS
jgi:hypothetical protein